MTDQSSWHSVSLNLPFPTPENSSLVKSVIQVDKPLRPNELTRTVTVSGSSLIIEFKTSSVRHLRVALDHCLSEIQLIVQTMHKFSPDRSLEEGKAEEESIEIGLMGSWGGGVQHS